MPDEHPVALLIPWYATETLSPTERAEVEQHLPQCKSCRELLEHARGQTELTQSTQAERDHVDPALLTQYVEHPETLEPETVRWVESQARFSFVAK